jgi:hypothetical protein
MPDVRLLIDVRGGLVQEVYMTPGLPLRVFKIDWDSIEEADDDDPAWAEWLPADVTQDEFDELLKAAETKHAERRKCRHCNAPLTDHDESRCPEKLWKDNDLQFPRLLARVQLTAEQKQLLAQSLDVTEEKIDDLLGRATNIAAASEKRFNYYPEEAD